MAQRRMISRNLSELQHQAQVKANSEWIAKVREDWKRKQSDGGAT